MPPREGEGLPVPEEGDSPFGMRGCEAQGWPERHRDGGGRGRAPRSWGPRWGDGGHTPVAPGDWQAGGRW